MPFKTTFSNVICLQIIIYPLFREHLLLKLGSLYIYLNVSPLEAVLWHVACNTTGSQSNITIHVLLAQQECVITRMSANVPYYVQVMCHKELLATQHEFRLINMHISYAPDAENFFLSYTNLNKIPASSCNLIYPSIHPVYTFIPSLHCSAVVHYYIITQ